ncbi:MAG: hypothetical protein ACYTGR_16505 [Planctomycetota bacterium]|jgi:hypothetical protein
MRTSFVFVATALGLATPLHASMTSGGPIDVLSHSVVHDPTLQQVIFTIEFDRAPDFFTLDDIGRQHDAFQFYVDSNPATGGPGPYAWDRIVRGAEIHFDNDVRIRDSTLPDVPGEPSGGWGPVVDAVPYALSDTELSFSVSFESLGTTTGVFEYDFLTTHYGAASFFADGLVSQPIPTPASALLLLACLSLQGRRRTHPRSSSRSRRFSRSVA